MPLPSAYSPARVDEPTSKQMAHASCEPMAHTAPLYVNPWHSQPPGLHAPVNEAPWQHEVIQAIAHAEWQETFWEQQALAQEALAQFAWQGLAWQQEAGEEMSQTPFAPGGGASLQPAVTDPTANAILKNLPSRAQREDLLAWIERLGFSDDLRNLKIPMKRDVRRPNRLQNKGFAFVQLADAEVCQRFVQAAAGSSIRLPTDDDEDAVLRPVHAEVGCAEHPITYDD